MGGEGHAELSPQIALTFSYSLSLTLLMYIRNLLPPDPLEGHKHAVIGLQTKVLYIITHKLRQWEISKLEIGKVKFSA